MSNSSFSVLLPTYSGDEPIGLSEALESVVTQTCSPDEILIVMDGDLTQELEAVVEEYVTEYPNMVEPLMLSERCRLGTALRRGVEAASNELIARQDADDLSVPDRFERQISFLDANPEVDVVGGSVEEFDENMSRTIGKREVPTTHDEIRRMARFRCPMNHMTVVFRRKSVLDAGNYRDTDPMEDYDLWIRMLMNGARFANLPEVLSKVRAGTEMYHRRGGWEYARQEISFQREFHRKNFISTPVFLFNVITRTTLRLIPNRARKEIYEGITRN